MALNFVLRRAHVTADFEDFMPDILSITRNCRKW